MMPDSEAIYQIYMRKISPTAMFSLLSEFIRDVYDLHRVLVYKGVIRQIIGYRGK